LQRHPKQIENLLEKIKTCIEAEEYRFSDHAVKRGVERFISYQDTLYVLANGLHEKEKTTFDLKHQTWKYAIRGKTVDRIDTRVVVAFKEKMVVITVIRLIKKTSRRYL
jgi:pectin methylesterase-like acyl-CoA thioesterase